MGGGDAIGPAAAGSAALEAEDEPRPGRAAPVMGGADAEGAVIALEQRRPRFDELEARPPHERAIGEDPEIAAFRRLQLAGADELRIDHGSGSANQGDADSRQPHAEQSGHGQSLAQEKIAAERRGWRSQEEEARHLGGSPATDQ